jgi:hypothetical protein
MSFSVPRLHFLTKVSHLIDDVVWVIPWMILPGPNTTSFDPARNSTLNSDTGEVFLFKIPITVACLWRYHTLLIFVVLYKGKLCVFVHVCFGVTELAGVITASLQRYTQLYFSRQLSRARRHRVNKSLPA